MKLETERKFLMNDLGHAWVKAWMPPTDGYGIYTGSYLIDQGYLYVSDYSSTRVRYQAPMNMPGAIADGFVTRKTRSDQANSNGEEEIRIPPKAALILLDTCAHKLSKHRAKYLANGREWEIDMFTDTNNQGLVLCELEFSSVEDSLALDMDNLPPWVGEEVTNDHRYKNSNLVQRGWNSWKNTSHELM